MPDFQALSQTTKFRLFQTATFSRLLKAIQRDKKKHMGKGEIARYKQFLLLQQV